MKHPSAYTENNFEKGPAKGNVRFTARKLFMHNWAKYGEEEDIAKRYLPDHYTIMVREGEEINPDKGRKKKDRLLIMLPWI